jgi:hypothetical protein
MKTAAISAIALFLLGAPAAAQTANEGPPPPPPAANNPAAPAQTAPQPESYSDTQVDSFAKAVVSVQEIQTNATLDQEQKQEAMVAAVEEAGLDPQTYNSISQAAQADQQLLERIQLAVAERTGQPTSQ